MSGQPGATSGGASTSRATIGVFDSGVGGLSVVRALRRLNPNAPVLYLSDAGYAPYGPRTDAALRQRSAAIATLLAQRGAQALVIACNTATAAAADSLRAAWSLPIIGMEPAVKPAARATNTGTIAVFATDGTLASQRFAGLLARHSRDTRVLVEPCGDLVAYAESGDWDGQAVRQACRRHLETVIAAGADTVVLGCTHFPLLRSMLSEVARGAVHFVDTGEAVARQILQRTSVPPAPATAPIELLTTGDPNHLTAMARRLFEFAGPAERIPVTTTHEPGD